MKTLSVEDVQKLKKNEKLFINKPLKVLLNAIKPEIKYATATTAWTEGLGRFYFKFVTLEESQKISSRGKKAISIIVYVKDNFEWDSKKRFDEKRFTWDKKDKKNYGNLTVVSISILGDTIISQ